MLDEDKILKIKWLIALNESKIDRRGSLLYQQPKSDTVFDIHARTHGINLGLRAYNHPEIIKWLKSNTFDLFQINQDSTHFDKKLLPSLGINFNEYEVEPISNTVHTVLEFLNIHADKRPTILQNEFWYHQEIIKNKISHYKQLKKGDVFVHSLPFFEDFKPVADLEDMLEHCSLNEIPVFLDLIWLPLTYEKIQIKNYDCVEVLCHSFTKTLPIAGIKGGFAFWRKPITQAKKLYPLGNKLGMYLSVEYMKIFGYYFVRDTLRDLQTKWCRILELQPHDFVYTGIIPKGHVLENQHLHNKMVPDSSLKLYNLIPFFENDKEISQFLNIDIK